MVVSYNQKGKLNEPKEEVQENLITKVIPFCCIYPYTSFTYAFTYFQNSNIS